MQYAISMQYAILYKCNILCIDRIPGTGLIWIIEYFFGSPSSAEFYQRLHLLLKHTAVICCGLLHLLIFNLHTSSF